MAIKLTSKPDTIPAGGAYPHGDIRDRAGATPGTPVSRQVYSDFHQFFEQMMSVSGTVHNDLPDNQANGFQLFQAMQNLYGVSKSCILLFSNPGPNGQVIVKGINFLTGLNCTKTGTGTYRITATGLSLSAQSNLFHFSNSYNLAGNYNTVTVVLNNGADAAPFIEIQIRVSGSLSDAISIDNYPIKIERIL